MPVKVAVSIPDPLFEQAERVSHRMRIPRSQLYSRALQAFVRQHSGEEVTARMDAALEQIRASRDPEWEALGLEIVRRERW